MPAVRIEDKAWTDWRFIALGRRRYPQLHDVDAADLARMKFMRLVSQCTETQTYTLPAVAVDAIGGDGFAAALIEAQLGEQDDRGLVRILGTEGRIEWKERLRQNAKRAGAANHARASARRTRAEPESNQTVTRIEPEANQTRTRTEPEPNPPTPTTSPATTTEATEGRGACAPAPDAGFAEGSSTPVPEATAAEQVPTKRQPPTPPPEAVEVAEYLLEAIRSHNPGQRGGDKAVDKSARDVDLAMRRDHRTASQLIEAIDFAHRPPHRFWAARILTGEKLREKFDELAIDMKQRPGTRPLGGVRDQARELYQRALDLEARGRGSA